MHADIKTTTQTGKLTRVDLLHCRKYFKLLPPMSKFPRLILKNWNEPFPPYFTWVPIMDKIYEANTNFYVK